MEFMKFAQLLHPVIGGSSSTGIFVKTLFDAMVTEEGRLALEEVTDSSYRSYFNGHTGISRIAKKISPYIETENFVSYLELFGDETINSLCDSFREYIPDINPFNAGQLLAELFRDIIKAAASSKRKSPAANKDTKKEKTPNEIINEKLIASGKAAAEAWGNAIARLADSFNQPLTPMSPTRYDSGKHIIYLNGEEIKLPVELVPENDIDAAELPYVHALCEIYAERLEREITPSDISSLPPALRKNFSDQRKAYYSAESVQRSVREVFADGEQQFNNLKEDAYEGIEPTYYDEDYATGYERLKAVLEKITSTTLTKSTLMSVVGLIGNLEKKGICHLLVNDEKIKSWVNIYDETI